jgi:selenocysteine-specific elongation factor
MKTNLILGTAGHIDHGKTSLIRALTGTDTDRLPEEKKRGITIELGYALLELDEFRLGIVDVPGHEKFVRQMLSGATGMDLAMLIVAADDSVKRQTIEHLDILRLLSLRGGLIVITKSDLVEPEWLSLVRDEVRQLVAGTFLHDAEMIAVSSVTGAGIEDLKAAIVRAARKVVSSGGLSDPAAPFRMAVDRVFPIEGHGTVVTGSVSSGSARVGDKLEVQPGGSEVRIREIQNHDLAVEVISRGQRGAINLAGIHHDQIERGQEIAAPGHLQPTRIVTARISVLRNCPRGLRDRQRIRFHIGTAEIPGTTRLLEKKELAAGETGLAQFFLSSPVVAVWDQPFVIRNESPLETIGGGSVLHPEAPRIRHVDPEIIGQLEQLGNQDPVQRVRAVLSFDILNSASIPDLARIAGVATPEPIVQQLVASGEVQRISITAHKTLYVHKRIVQRIAGEIRDFLHRFHQSDPLAMGATLTALENHFAWLDSRDLFALSLKSLSEDGKIHRTGNVISLEGFGPQLTASERKLFTTIIDRFERDGLEPPTLEILQKEASKSKSSIPQLVKLAVDQGTLASLGDGIFLHAATIEKIKGVLAPAMTSDKGITMSDIRTLLGTTRKYAVPIGEYLDSIGFTRREGDLRFAAEKVSST